MIGTSSGSVRYSESILLSTNNVTLIVLNWLDVDNITMHAVSPSTSQATWYTIDNMCLA